MTTKAKTTKEPTLLATRARRLKISLYLLLATTVFTVPLSLGHIYDLSTIGLAETPNQRTIFLLTLADTIQTMTFILAIGTFLVWTWTAARNLDRLPTPPRPTPSPTEAVLCWFIPILNLHWSHQVLKKLLHGSLRTRPDQWHATQPITLFWVGWINLLLHPFHQFRNHLLPGLRRHPPAPSGNRLRRPCRQPGRRNRPSYTS